MHEYSLVRSLLRQVETIVSDEGGGVVEEVRIEVGAFSGVDITLLELAFADEASRHLGYQPRLQTTAVPLEVECQRCRSRSVIEDFEFRCSECGHQQVIIVSGEEVRLMEIEIRELNNAS
ncbi:MAG: hydrogenase maturation nickel metallochaperone HypA [Planctomycetaceae bacterium]|nr:hydrogenase maturation nickel metallochaperone HypA [Planctomycetaceae bacterium]MCA9044584.1 hydrogenase maturation nickel metallochaperone HypA [Planctomycetaceae bacterium]MCB9949931.1 hydrogenase maturation nickel metallochaperone HypA [Planctomycetaceae bacterium]